MDSELAVVTQEQDTGIAITTFVKTSAQLSVLVKIRILGISRQGYRETKITSYCFSLGYSPM